MSQMMPLPLTVSCFSKIRIGFTFLVLAHPGSPGQTSVKWVCVSIQIYNSCIFLWQTELPEDVNVIEHRRLSGLLELTEGGFGIVYRAEHEDWGTVAYKELKASIIKPETRLVLW